MTSLHKCPAGDVARVSFAWSENQGFLVSHFTTTFKNIAIGGGTQWIGWDPRDQQLRSWTFDTDGGFGDQLADDRRAFAGDMLEPILVAGLVLA